MLWQPPVQVLLVIFLTTGSPWPTGEVDAFPLRPTRTARRVSHRIVRHAPPVLTMVAASIGNETSASAKTSNPPAQHSNGGTRWTDSGRWEASQGDSYLLKEKYGTYFQVPNPASLMTKIICTIGPATSDTTTLGKMMDAGMTAARINMSHGGSDYTSASKIIDNIRAVAVTRQKLCPIILDTKGPEIRVCWLGESSQPDPANSTGHNTDSEPDQNFLAPRPLRLKSGASVVLMTGTHIHQSEDGTASVREDAIERLSPTAKSIPQKVAVTYPYLAQAVAQGDVVLLDDGRISLIVMDVLNDNEVRANVIEGGILVQNKGVNLPGCHVELPHLTEKDKRDIAFGISKRVEYIAHSFTRSATGINQVRELPGVVETGVHLIAKIESQEGLDNFDAILGVSDGIMVARGDLGVEIPLERVCSVQKRLVASCNAVGKPVVVATELLDSMIHHPRPTRAEASDVANAVFDGADCVMLSGETAVGKYPIEAIQVMTRICKEAELDVKSSLRAMKAAGGANGFVDATAAHQQYEGGALRDAFSKAAISAARETNADLILVLSRTGLTTNALAKFFSSVPVMVLSTSLHVCNQVLLHRSVTPYYVSSLKRESCVPRAIAKATELGLVRPGSRVLLLTGKDDMIANRLETFVVGEHISIPPLLQNQPSDDPLDI